MDLSAARGQVALDLASTGLRVATDPKHAHAPCVLVGPVTEVEVGGLCAWSCEIPVWLIAPAPGDQRAVDWLAANVTAVIDALDEATTATLGTTDVGQGDLPAYEIISTYVAKE